MTGPTITAIPLYRIRPSHAAAIRDARKAVQAARHKLLSLLTAEVVARDGPLCHYCGQRTVVRTAIASDASCDRTVDHKEPVDRGGKDELDNLVLACRACNSAKGTLPYTVFIAQHRPVRIHVLGVDGYRTGQRIRHRVFGDGVVVQVDGTGVVAAFGNGRER